MEDSHLWDKFIMHASPKKNQPKILFVSYEFQSLYFYNKESLKKKSNMYLMKIQINFEFRVNQICI